jgi:hypothetical protein
MSGFADEILNPAQICHFFKNSCPAFFDEEFENID